MPYLKYMFGILFPKMLYGVFPHLLMIHLFSPFLITHFSIAITKFSVFYIHIQFE